MIKRRAKFIWGGLFFLGVIAGVGAITMLLWNALIPAIFGGIEITYWQAVGLLILGRLLLGGFGRWHSHAHHAHHHFTRDRHIPLHNMSMDERKEFIRNRFREHGFDCCGKDHPEATSSDKE